MNGGAKRYLPPIDILYCLCYYMHMSQKQAESPAVLYRIENPSAYSVPNGETSHAELVGQWFSPNLDTALNYLRKSTQTFGKDAHPIDGAQLVIASLPMDQLETHHVSHHPIAATMDVEGIIILFLEMVVLKRSLCR